MQELDNTLGFFALAIVGMFILVDCAKDARKLVSSRNVFLLSITAWYLMEACIVPDELLQYEQSEYDACVSMTLACVICFLVGYHSQKGGCFDAVFKRLAKADHPKVLYRIFLAALAVGFSPLLFAAEGNVVAIFEDAFMPGRRWSGLFQRGRFGGIRDAFLELQMFLKAAIPLGAAVAVDIRQRTSGRLIAVFFLIYMFAGAFNSGARARVVVVMLPIAACVYWRFSPGQKKLAITFGLPIVFVLALAWSSASVVTRNSGEFDITRATEAEYVGFEMFRELLFLNNRVPERVEHKWGHTYYVQLVNPIPRFLWKGKPTADAGLELAEMQGATVNGRASMTISPGIIGEMYWNFGTMGIVFLSGFLGYVAKSWDRVRALSERSIVAFSVFGAGLAIIFLLGRSFNMVSFYGMIALLALLIYFQRNSQPIGSR